MGSLGRIHGCHSFRASCIKALEIVEAQPGSMTHYRHDDVLFARNQPETSIRETVRKPSFINLRGNLPVRR